MAYSAVIMYIFLLLLGAYSEMKNLQVAKEGSIDEAMDEISSEGN